jgi:uncharacterized protein YecA (UPF0149 family)
MTTDELYTQAATPNRQGMSEKRRFKVLPCNIHVGCDKVGRNERCRCGSGLKFKKCCGR